MLGTLSAVSAVLQNKRTRRSASVCAVYGKVRVFWKVTRAKRLIGIVPLTHNMYTSTWRHPSPSVFRNKYLVTIFITTIVLFSPQYVPIHDVRCCSFFKGVPTFNPPRRNLKVFRYKKYSQPRRVPIHNTYYVKKNIFHWSKNVFGLSENLWIFFPIIKNSNHVNSIYLIFNVFKYYETGTVHKRRDRNNNYNHNTVETRFAKNRPFPFRPTDFSSI